MKKRYYVYLLASLSRTLYVGMTNDLERRVYEHKNNLVPGFTSKYRINRLAYFEEFDTPLAAIEAERRLRGWTRARKIELIQQQNPNWRDLSESWEPPIHGPAVNESAGSNAKC
jgi:putative endonuclease